MMYLIYFKKYNPIQIWGITEEEAINYALEILKMSFPEVKLQDVEKTEIIGE